MPLGGLGEFGMNALVLEWSGHSLLVDAGMAFASAEMPGVDSIVPDFEYLREHRDSVRGILLTHGHEEHIGARPRALQGLQSLSRQAVGLVRPARFGRRPVRDLAGVVADIRGHVIVADKLKCVVMVFDKDFNFLTEFGMRGLRPENLIIPDEVAIDKRHSIYYNTKDGTLTSVNYFKEKAKAPGAGLKIIQLDGMPGVKEVSAELTGKLSK